MGLFLRGDHGGPLEIFCGQRPADQIILLSPHDKEEGAAYKTRLAEKTGALIKAVNIPVRDLTEIQGVYNSLLAVLRYAKENHSPQDDWEIFLTPGGVVPTALWLLSPLYLEGILPRFWYLNPLGEPEEWQGLTEPDDRLLHLSEGASNSGEKSFLQRRAEVILNKRGYLTLLSRHDGDAREYLSLLFPHRGIKTVEGSRGEFRQEGESLHFLPAPEILPWEVQEELARFLSEIRRNEAAGFGNWVIATEIDVNQGVSLGRVHPALADELAPGSLRLPLLPPDHRDMIKVIHHYTDALNDQYALRQSFQKKKLTSALVTFLTAPPVPFPSLRELKTALEQAFLLSEGEEISLQEMKNLAWDQGAEEKPPAEKQGRFNPLDYPLEEGVDLKDLIQEVARYYLSKAMKITGGNKTRSAELLGLPHYQTLTNWLRKYGLEEKS